jgi:hypothetical protein
VPVPFPATVIPLAALSETSEFDTRRLPVVAKTEMPVDQKWRITQLSTVSDLALLT